MRSSEDSDVDPGKYRSSSESELVLLDSSGENIARPWEEAEKDDPNEPYIESWSSMPISPANYLDSDDSSNPCVFNSEWMLVRRAMRREIERRDAESAARDAEEKQRRAEKEAHVPHNVCFTVSVAHIRHMPGARVCVCGGHPALGNWRPKEGLEMQTTPDTFPLFTASIFLPPSSQVRACLGLCGRAGEVECTGFSG